jgi:hypothetical protein
LKREFSSKERDEAAESGAALPDGSFPIKNASDLKNAMRAIGRAKDPAKAKAHIRARAKALGLSDQLSDAFKSAGSKLGSWLAKMFSSSPALPSDQQIAATLDKSVKGLAQSVHSIINDESADKPALLSKSFEQFHDHLVSTLGGERPVTTDTGDTIMSDAVLKALGLASDASEQDVLKSIDVLKAKKKEREEDEEEEEEKEKARRNGRKEEDEEEEEEEEEREKALATLPASIRKQLNLGVEAMEEVKKLRRAAQLEQFTKQAEEIGLARSEGETLLKAWEATSDKAAFDKMVGHIKTANAALAGSEFGKEFGSRQGGPISDDPMIELQAKADEYHKAHPDLTVEQAFTKVYENASNRKLVAKERARNRPI